MTNHPHHADLPWDHPHDADLPWDHPHDADLPWDHPFDDDALADGAATVLPGRDDVSAAEDDDAWDLASALDAVPPPGRPVRGHGDALVLLLQLVGPDRAGPPALWFVVLDAHDCTVPVVLPLADVPLTASPGVAAHVMHVLASVLERDAPGGSVLVGLVRAAGGDRGTFETSWAPVLRAAADDRGVRLHAVAAIGASRARVIEW